MLLILQIWNGLGHLGQCERILVPVANFSGATPSVSRSATLPVSFIQLLSSPSCSSHVGSQARSAGPSSSRALPLLYCAYDPSLVAPASLMENH